MFTSYDIEFNFEKYFEEYILEAAKVKEFLECELTYVPNMEVSLDEEAKELVIKLIETLEDLDDVQDVYCNLKDE